MVLVLQSSPDHPQIKYRCLIEICKQITPAYIPYEEGERAEQSKQYYSDILIYIPIYKQ